MSCVGLDLAPDSRIPPGLRILNGDNHQPQCVPTDHATIQSAVFTMKFMSCQEDNYVNEIRLKSFAFSPKLQIGVLVRDIYIF